MTVVAGRAGEGTTMRASGYLVVSVTFAAVALLALVVIARLGLEQQSLAFVIAAIVASQVGVLLWHRRSPGSSQRSVKLGLGLVLLATVVPLALVVQVAARRR